MNEENAYNVSVRVDVYNASRGGGLTVERRFTVQKVKLGDVGALLMALNTLFDEIEQTLAGEKV